MKANDIPNPANTDSRNQPMTTYRHKACPPIKSSNYNKSAVTIFDNRPFALGLVKRGSASVCH